MEVELFMPSLKRFDVTGYKNQTVPNMYIDFGSDQLAIFLPGIGYTNDSPILHYTGSYLLQKEINILRVDYRYSDSDEFLNSTKGEQAHWIIEDVKPAVEAVLSEKDFKKIILIGKSMGTIALGEILSSITKLKDAEVIWLTPLINHDELVAQILKINNRSLLIMGTEDHAYKADQLEKILEKKNVDSLIIEGLNHSLEIENQIIESIHASQKILLKIMSFV